MVDTLAEKGLAARLTASRPQGLPETLLALEVNLRQPPFPESIVEHRTAHGFWDIVGVLAGAVRRSPPQGLDTDAWGEKWSITEGPVQKGSSIVDPQLLEIASRFP